MQIPGRRHVARSRECAAARFVDSSTGSVDSVICVSAAGDQDFAIRKQRSCVPVEQAKANISVCPRPLMGERASERIVEFTTAPCISAKGTNAPYPPEGKLRGEEELPPLP